MSLAVLYSRALSGMEAELVTVEVHLAGGLPGFTIVGLPETVEAARAKQLARQQKCNARLSAMETDGYCKPDAEGEVLLRLAIRRLDLSARAYHRVLRLARSIADLEDDAAIDRHHIAEAVQYRRMDRN